MWIWAPAFAAQDGDTEVLLCIYCIVRLFCYSAGARSMERIYGIRVGKMNNQVEEHALCGAAPEGNAPVNTLCGAAPVWCGLRSNTHPYIPEGDASADIIACPLFWDTE